MVSIRLAFKEMIAEKMRVMLTVFAVAWGTASIAGMLAVGEGLRTTFGSAMNNAGPGLLYLLPDKTTYGYRGLPAKTPVYVTPEDLSLAQHHWLQQATILGEYQFSGMPLHHNNQKAAFYDGRGVPAEYGKLRALHIAAPGRFINDDDQQQHRRVVVLGDRVAQWLFPKGSAVGQNITLGQWSFRVIGVSEKKMQMASFGSSDDFQIWIPQSTYELLNPIHHFNDWLILANNPNDNPSLAAQMRQFIAKRHGLDPKDPGIVSTVNLYEYQQKSSEVFTGMQIFLGLIGSITLFVAGLGIANVMFVSVRRATRLIGVQMAMGAMRRHIMSHYLMQALLVTLCGGLLGIIGAVVIITTINHIPIHSDVFEMIGKPHPILSWTVLVATIGVLTIIGLVSGFLPARKAANINPVEALMYE